MSFAETVRQNTRCQLVQYDETKHDQDCCLRPKETIPNAPRTCNRLCWRKCQRFVIVSPWYTQFHLAVSVNMITGIKHRRPRTTPGNCNWLQSYMALYPSLYRSPLRSSAIEPPPLHPLPGPRIPPAAVIAIVIVHLSRAKSIVSGCRFEFLHQKATSLTWFFCKNRQRLDNEDRTLFLLRFFEEIFPEVLG